MGQAVRHHQPPPPGARPFLQQAEQLNALPLGEAFPETTAALQTLVQQYPDLWHQKIGLVYGGATKIKPYVFESAKIHEIRGASALLDRINFLSRFKLAQLKAEIPFAIKIFGEPRADLLQNRTFFSIDLQADAILTEHWQRTMVISEAMLKQFAAVEDDSLQLHAAYSSYKYRSGWNAAWGLMKDVELVTNQGAVYLFSTTQPERWIEPLAAIELKGVGERTSEGFGQVQICNEFHTVFPAAAT